MRTQFIDEHEYNQISNYVRLFNEATKDRYSLTELDVIHTFFTPSEYYNEQSLTAPRSLAPIY